MTAISHPFLSCDGCPPNLLTRGVVGVVRVLIADAHNTSRGPKCQILTKNPPFSFFQNKVGCPPFPYKKIWAKKLLIISRNSAKHIWPHWPNIEVPEKAEPGKRSSVMMLDTPSQVPAGAVHQNTCQHWNYKCHNCHGKFCCGCWRWFLHICSIRTWASPHQSTQQRRSDNLLLEYSQYLEDPATELRMLYQYPHVKALFLKYNLPIPSPAPVERLLSFGGLKHTVKRNRLSDEMFKTLLMLKANTNLCI